MKNRKNRIRTTELFSLKMSLKKWLFFIVIACIGILLTARFSSTDKNHYENSQTVVALRNVAHQTLLISGDSLSPVPPVQKTGKAQYKISFNTSVSIHPDSLVESFISSFDEYANRQHYLVEVKECFSNEIVYAYEMFGTKDESIIPCINRSLSENCYTISVLFHDPGFFEGNNPIYLIGSSLIFLAFISGSYFSKSSKKSASDNLSNPPYIELGLFQFFPDELQLSYQNEVIALTSKEAELLTIFAKNLNQIVSREKLEKEIWEDKGVIVGRSLDVFISKLRKKLKKDPAIQLINVHGVGYKLNIDTN